MIQDQGEGWEKERSMGVDTGHNARCSANMFQRAEDGMGMDRRKMGICGGSWTGTNSMRTFLVYGRVLGKEKIMKFPRLLCHNPTPEDLFEC